MYLQTLETSLTPRGTADAYHARVNDTALDILSLVFEFKVATAWQINRFLGSKDQSTYLYRKLRRMWKAGILESVKVYPGSGAGLVVYYLLSKAGLKILAEQGRYVPMMLKTYPPPKTLLSSNLFKHEAAVVELASLEFKNNSKHLKIAFKGEASSMTHEARSDKNIEVLTPDYTVTYAALGKSEIIYTEFERTVKSKEAMIRKLERYSKHLAFHEREHVTIRLIFETSDMEQSFWFYMMTHHLNLVNKIRICSTNHTLLATHQAFCEPVYAESKTIKFKKEGRLNVDMSNRTKLFYFL